MTENLSFKTITLWVVAAHFFVLLALTFMASEWLPSAMPRKKIKVQTVLLKESIQEKPASRTSLAKPKPIEPRKPQVSKPAIKEHPKTAAVKELPKPAQKVPESVKKQESSREVGDAIAKAKQRLKSKQRDIEALPATLSISSQSKSLEAQEASYSDDLIEVLKHALRLPEKGDVRLKLTLGRSGAIRSVTVLESKSLVNKAYAEKNIPLLSFPPFGNYFLGKGEYTFMITLELSE